MFSEIANFINLSLHISKCKLDFSCNALNTGKFYICMYIQNKKKGKIFWHGCYFIQ